MADFCYKCSIEHFGKDLKDLDGIITKTQFEDEKLAGVALCEGCGPIYVDPEGRRVKPNTDKTAWVYY